MQAVRCDDRCPYLAVRIPPAPTWFVAGGRGRRLQLHHAGKTRGSPRSRRSSTNMWRIVIFALFAAVVLVTGTCPPAWAVDPRPRDGGLLRGSYRFERDGWIYVHLEGPPEQIGFQHGSLLANEIADFLRVIKPFLEKSTQARLELLPASVGEDALERHRPGISARDRRDRGGLEIAEESRPTAGTWSRSTPTRSCRITTSPGSTRRRESADHARSWQLQRLHRDREAHEGRPDRHGAQRLDQLCRRHALECRLRHQARQRAPASSWTVCRA